MDRATDYESVGQRFESSRAYCAESPIYERPPLGGSPLVARGRADPTKPTNWRISRWIAAATQSNGNDSAVPLARLILNSLSRPNGIDCVHGTDEDFSVAMLAGFCSRLNRSNGAIEL